MQANDITIRAAARGDLEHLAILYAELNAHDEVLEPHSAAQIYEQVLAHPGLTIFVAAHNERAIATATLVVVPNFTRGGRPYAVIENVVTLKDFRGQGLGRSVVKHAIAAAWDASCYKVMLLTGRTDPAVHRFYEGCGFIQNKTGFQIRNP
ncbi:GNAT family N-acetyltransferase [Agrobacterium rubi]|uniref:GNAT family N-acetyltransferase n=1 Tax=Agrobacterium rubi TaxID=28099 RepID=UPI0015730B89|nr:GNAT family N-acetyltransferase [Agrobacterium rubi]NTF08086.1 GNAT family N-acetyltransferase [Agrobacterium rubi]NTF20314.1 GNAT family N-acetyltransferase [Agrobacterium rubi]NTF27285.1 GNAT family N-acetyltransferase [Agrobacterium rubi]